MSCEYRRRKFLGMLVSSGAAGGEKAEDLSAQVASLERIYQQAYDAARSRRGEAASPLSSTLLEQENRRKTRLLFGHMLRMGVSLPVHSASGLPKPEAQAGYAALWDALKARMTPQISVFAHSVSAANAGQVIASTQVLARYRHRGPNGRVDWTLAHAH